MANSANVRIRYATITYGTTDLGHTTGGVKFSYNPKFTDLVVDQYGKTAVDKGLDSEVVQAVVSFSEIVYTTFKNIFVLASSSDGTSPFGNVKAGSNAASLLGATAKKLTIHPSNQTDASEDIVIHKAAITDIGDMELTPDKQTVVPVTFMGLIDESQPTGQRLFRIGPASVS